MLKTALDKIQSFTGHHPALIASVGLAGLALYQASRGDYTHALESLLGSLGLSGLYHVPAGANPDVSTLTKS